MLGQLTSIHSYGLEEGVEDGEVLPPQETAAQAIQITVDQSVLSSAKQQPKASRGCLSLSSVVKG